MKENKKKITSPEIALLQIPLEQLLPKPNLLSRLFRKWQKNEVHDTLLPQRFALVWRKVPKVVAYYIANCTILWINLGHQAQVKQQQGQKSNEYIRHYIHSYAGLSEWKTSYRWWLQDNVVHLAVSFEAPTVIFETLLNDALSVLSLWNPSFDYVSFQTSQNISHNH